MSSLKDNNLSSLEYAVAGGVSGFVTRFCCQPLDVLKILFQLQVDPKSSSKYTSIIQSLSMIVKEEGITALWKGHIPAQWLSIAYGALQFSAYEKILNISRQLVTPDNSSVIFNDTALHFYAGGASGVTAITLSFPFDTIRTRLVVQPKCKLYKGMIDAANQIWVKEGPKGYFRGLIPACLQIAPSAGLVFGFKNVYTQVWNFYVLDSPELFHIRSEGHMVTGLLAGITSKLIVYPLDVIKKRLQIQGMEESNICLNTKSSCKGVIDCITLLFKNEGFFGLYKGIAPALLKSGMASAINFTIYNEMCKLFNYTKR